MDIQYGFWEGSWEEDALRCDREAGVFTDPAKVHVVHDGEYFRVDGAHLCEPSPQRTPVLYQAGSSSKGTAFAARIFAKLVQVDPTRSRWLWLIRNQQVRGSNPRVGSMLS